MNTTLPINPSDTDHEAKILVFDNYDSFTYNLVQIIERILGRKVDVVRNDEISLEDIAQYDNCLLYTSPSPRD